MAASVSTTSTTSHLLHHLLRPPPPPTTLLSSVIRPLCIASSSTASAAAISSKCRRLRRNYTLFSSGSASPLPSSPFLSHLFFSSQSSPSHTLPSVKALSPDKELEEDDDEIEEYSEEEDEEDSDEFEEFSDDEEYEFEDEDEFESEDEDEEIEGELGIGAESENGKLGETIGKSSEMVGTDPAVMLRSSREKGLQKISMTLKEKKELASYAHSLGKKLTYQLVGKGGVTANVAASFGDILEAHELLKVKIHVNCPEEQDDAVKKLEELTGSVVVSQIGRTIILYRPSLTKIKAEEKKRQAQKLFAKKETRRPRPTFWKGGKESKPPSRGRRRSTSRF